MTEKMDSNRFIQMWRAHLTVAFFVGLALGIAVGLVDGISVLVLQGLLGRYNELVAWAILFDACAIIAVEVGLAVLNAIIFTVLRWETVPYRLVALLLGESVFTATLAFGLWTQGTENLHLLATSPINVILFPAIVGIVLGEIALAVIRLIVDQLPLIRRLNAPYWLAAEAVVVIGAVAFSLTR